MMGLVTLALLAAVPFHAETWRTLWALEFMCLLDTVDPRGPKGK
jgi:hypothetical protein